MLKIRKENLVQKVDVANMRPSQICQLHTATREALHDSIGGIETENARLKDRIKELEDAFIPMPLLVNPLAIAMPGTPAPNVKASSTLLASGYRGVENITNHHFPWNQGT
jgi:hypothetical protein